MKRFLLKLLVVLTPIWVIIGVYIVMDPFRVLRDYKDYYDGGKYDIWINHNMATIRTLKNITDSTGYRLFDSFIIGDSRATNFLAEDFKKYLPEGSHVYHLDAYADVIETIYDKISYIDQHGYHIRHVLMPVNHIMTSHTDPIPGYRFISPPEAGHNKVKFHIETLRAYLDPRFMDIFLIYKFYKHEITEPIPDWYSQPGLLDYDYHINQLVEVDAERRILSGTLITQHQADSLDAVRDSLQNSFAPETITPTSQERLKQIAKIFNRHNTDYKIVIIPLRLGIKYSLNDELKLKEIFGAENVIRLDTIRYPINYFYDDRHLSNALTRDILKRVYTPR